MSHNHDDSPVNTADQQQRDQRTADLIAELRKHIASRDKTIDRLRSKLAETTRRAETAENDGAFYLAERNSALSERDDAVREQNRMQALLDDLRHCAGVDGDTEADLDTTPL